MGPTRRSIRLRMAALLTALFVLLGGALLAVSYVLVRSNLTHDRQHGAASASGGLSELHQSLQPRQRRLLLEQVEAAQQQLADDALRQLTIQYLAILAAMAVLSAALGWIVAGRLLRPVSEITATARTSSRTRRCRSGALPGSASCSSAGR